MGREAIFVFFNGGKTGRSLNNLWVVPFDQCPSCEGVVCVQDKTFHCSDAENFNTPSCLSCFRNDAKIQ